LVSVKGGEVLSLGGREVEVIYTPGHARHHVCYLDRTTGAVFTGDAAGIVFPRDNRLLPTTPFPEFDFPTALQAMETIRGLRPSHLLFTHFGSSGDVDATLTAMAEEYRRWDARVRQGGTLDTGVLTRTIYDEWYRGIKAHPRGFVERIIETNIRGFRSYYERVAKGP
jgi:glyoxylase-like metal-dependent hydrolase (beta-lactamase superfamily II)